MQVKLNRIKIAFQTNRTEYIIIFSTIVINLILHLIADFNSGFLGDEFLHIDAGRHPAFGYMDFPPLIAWLAFIQNLFCSDSILVNHLFVHIATALIMFFIGLITIESGGKWLAVLISLSCILFSPGLGASQGLFLPVVFEQLFWVICILIIVKYCNQSENNYLIFAGIFAAFAFLTKYGILFLVAGVFFSVLIFQAGILKKKSFWISILLFLLIVSPNVYWQLNNGFPAIHHFSKLYETQLGNISFQEELKYMFLYLNPLTSIFWVSGLLVVPFIPRFKKLRLVTFALLFTFILMFIAKSKAYYYFPVILATFPFGAIFFEQLFPKRKMVLVFYLSILCLFGIVLLPNGMPILPLDKYISMYHLKKDNDNRVPLPFENYYSAAIWNQILQKVDSTYKNLPAAEQKECFIWGRHYSQSGGINLLGKKYNLPMAFSFHGSCFKWVPDFSKNATIIVISDFSWDKEHWLRFFYDVQEVGIITNPYAPDYEWHKQHIFLCRKLQYKSEELKQIFKNEIF